MKKFKRGRNVFGEKCVVKVATIYKETAKEQYIEILKDIRKGSACGLPVEYTCNYKGFTDSELKEFNQWMGKALDLIMFMAA